MRFFVLSVATALSLGALAGCSKNVSVDNHSTVTDSGGVSPDPGTVPDNVLAVSGMVIDSATNQPIDHALMTTEPPIGQILTNAEGNYVFQAADYPDLKQSQLYRITANKDGYLSNYAQVTLQGGHNKNVDILLTRSSASYYLKPLAPANLTFVDADFGSSATAAKSVTIQLDTQTADQTTYTANVDAADTAWLSVIPDNGPVTATASTVDVQVNRTSLPAGITSGSVKFIIPGDTQTLIVKVTLSSAADGG